LLKGQLAQAALFLRLIFFVGGGGQPHTSGGKQGVKNRIRGELKYKQKGLFGAAAREYELNNKI
jgi:hypothetical protein